MHPSFPAKTVSEFITYAKANPGKVNYGSAGVGSSLHMAGELFKLMAGVELVHVPYRGSPPALTDLLGGQVQLMFSPLPSSVAYVRSGRLRALAVTGAIRSRALPDVPIVADFVPGYEASSWYGIGAPRNTPAEIIDPAQQGDQRWARRAKNQGAIRRYRRHCIARLAGRFRQGHRRRHRKMGQGHPHGPYQAGVRQSDRLGIEKARRINAALVDPKSRRGLPT